MIRSLILASFAILSLAAPPLLLAGPTVWKADPVHSSVVFRVKHSGVTHFYGRFNDISGSFALDEADPAKSSLQVEIKAESVDTGNPARDKHVKSPDFLSVKEFPTISFKSREVKQTGDGAYEIAGDLTLHGVTKGLTLKLQRTGSGKDARRNSRLAGFETVFAIQRSEFGMKFALEGVSDEVQLTVSVACRDR
jgi:polyisoprenoid-binding protein YceI